MIQRVLFIAQRGPAVVQYDDPVKFAAKCQQYRRDFPCTAFNGPHCFVVVLVDARP